MSLPGLSTRNSPFVKVKHLRWLLETSKDLCNLNAIKSSHCFSGIGACATINLKYLTFLLSLKGCKPFHGGKTVHSVQQPLESWQEKTSINVGPAGLTHIDGMENGPAR